MTTEWHHDKLDTWEQFWIWWCWGKPKTRMLYNLYVHPQVGALVAHWDTADTPKPNDELLYSSEKSIELFPSELDKFGWDYEIENSIIYSWFGKWGGGRLHIAQSGEE